MRRRFVASLPERIVRAAAAAAGGATYETAQLVLPRLVRRSRVYDATAKNLLRVAIELVGGVRGAPSVEPRAEVGELAVRKGAGNVVELASIPAFGFSPLWLLAGASDLAHGSRIYLETLVAELKTARALGAEVDVESVDELLGVLERGSGRAAGLVDVPPVELAALRTTLGELAAERDALPSAAELAQLFRALRTAAQAERRPLLEVSAGVGLAFLVSARTLGREHLVAPYRDDWAPLRREGFAAYARRVARPYRETVLGHFDPDRLTWTERAMGRIARDV